jgi:putative PIN family toxin of toxin-antitoxin system
MPKIVLDTNVVVSALLKPGTKPDLILMLAFDKDHKICELCLSDEILTEYQTVLKYGKLRKHLDQNKIRRFLSELKKQSAWVTPRVPVGVLKDDPSDNKFLACSLEAKADFLITGNLKHFPFRKFHDTRIVGPAEFLDTIAEILFT